MGRSSAYSRLRAPQRIPSRGLARKFAALGTIANRQPPGDVSQLSQNSEPAALTPTADMRHSSRWINITQSAAGGPPVQLAGHPTACQTCGQPRIQRRWHSNYAAPGRRQTIRLSYQRVSVCAMTRPQEISRSTDPCRVLSRDLRSFSSDARLSLTCVRLPQDRFAELSP